MRARWFVGAVLAVAGAAVGLACGGGDDSSSGADAAAGADGSSAFDAGPPLHFCPEIADAALPDVWYPATIDQDCADALDPCPLPPGDCAFGLWHAAYTHGYCVQGKCVFTYRTAQCGGPNAACAGGACQCTGLVDN